MSPLPYPIVYPSILPLLRIMIKWMVLLSLCVTLCFLISCDNDPESDPDPLPEPEPTDELASANIGTDGGTLETEGFSLTVPAGAFDSETELKLYAETENYFGDPNISPIFKIEGLPSQMNNPVQIKIKPTVAPDSGTFLALGTPMGFVSEENPVFVYLLYPATESGGDLIALFQPDEELTDIFNSGRKSSPIFEINAYLWVGMKGRYREFRRKRAATTGEIKVNFPEIFNESWVKEGLDYVDIMDYSYKDVLEKFGTYKITDENLIIHINAFGSDKISIGEYIYAAARAELFPQPIILINSNYIDDNETFMAVLIRLHYQYILEKFDKNVLLPNRYWYHLAVTSFFTEGRNIVNGNKQALNWQGNELTALNGCIAGSGSNLDEATRHGYGLSSLIKYIYNHNTYMVHELYKLIPEKLKSTNTIIESINQIAKNNIEDWWSDYIQQLILGEIYEVPHQAVLDAVTETYPMDADSDSSYTFTDEFPDLSAKLYRVNLNKSFENQDYLSINVTGNASMVYVYKILEDKSLNIIHSGTNITIGELPDLVADGNDLLLLVVNSKNVAPYTGTTSIDCSVEHKKTEFPFNYCRIHVKAKGVWDDDSLGISESSFYIWWEAFGSYENGLFKADYRPDEEHVVTMEIEIDPQTLNILDFNATETEQDPVDNYIDYSAIEGSDKPLIGFKIYASREYLVEGEETGTYIDLITSYYGSPKWMTKLIDVNYDMNSELKIKFENKTE